MHSPEVWEEPQAHTLECRSLKRMHSYGNLSYNKTQTPLGIPNNPNSMSKFSFYLPIGKFVKIAPCVIDIPKERCHFNTID
jgi:hypothetical protein